MIPRFTLVAAILALAACGPPAATTGPAATTATTPTTAGTAPPVTAQPATSAPTTPPQTATSICIVSIPTQMLQDLTPVVIEYDGATAEQCATHLKVAPDASQWTKDHPPTPLSSPPSEDPECTVTVAGVRVTVWGKNGAEYVCQSLQAANPSTAP